MWHSRPGGPRALTITDPSLDCSFDDNTLVFVVLKNSVVPGQHLPPNTPTPLPDPPELINLKSCKPRSSTTIIAFFPALRWLVYTRRRAPDVKSRKLGLKD